MKSDSVGRSSKLESPFRAFAGEDETVSREILENFIEKMVRDTERVRNVPQQHRLLLLASGKVEHRLDRIFTRFAED